MFCDEKTPEKGSDVSSDPENGTKLNDNELAISYKNKINQQPLSGETDLRMHCNNRTNKLR
jgi:hypothetical protein